MSASPASSAPTQLEQLRCQHRAYFPIVNDPALLVAYVLDFFGPDGVEPLLSPADAQEAESLLMQRCDAWSVLCQARECKPLFVDAESDDASIPEQDLAVKLGLILEVIENAEALLGYFARVFGPTGPEGLAITDQPTWDRLDDLFLCRMPYPESFPVQSQGRTCSPYSLVYPRSECVESHSLPRHQQALPPSAAESEPPLLEPEVMPSQPAVSEPEGQRWSTLEIVGLCAVCFGVGVVGALAAARFGRALGSRSSAHVLSSAADLAIGAWGRRVFTGPRGGRYVITSNGTKSYSVP